MRTRLSSEGANSSTLPLDVLNSRSAMQVSESVDDNRRFQGSWRAVDGAWARPSQPDPCWLVLLTSQRAHWIDTGGASSRHIACEECYGGHQRPSQEKGRDIQRAGSIQHT